jgi:phage terminase small subunit
MINEHGEYLVPKSLTAKQQNFIDEYFVDFNGKAAALRAGYAESHAKQTAYKLLHTPYIQAALTKRKEELRESMGKLTPEQIVAQLAGIAFTDIAELFEEDGTVKNVHAIPEGIRRMIDTYESDGGKQKIKLPSRIKALDMLCKLFDLYKHEPAEQRVTVTHGIVFDDPDKQALFELTIGASQDAELELLPEPDEDDSNNK